MTLPKRMPSQIGEPFAAREYLQLKAAFAERYPDLACTAFLSREQILNSMEGASDLSGILFVYGLSDDNTAVNPITIWVRASGMSNNESEVIQIISSKAIFPEKPKLLPENNSHKAVNGRSRLSKPPKAYFWDINKIKKLLEIDHCSGLIFHFGNNPSIQSV